MGDKVVKTINEKSIIDGGNGEKRPLFLVRKTLSLEDEKRKTMQTQILVNEEYCIRNIEFLILFLVK